MLSWWRELVKVPSHEDHQEFTWKLHASFKVPKACNQAKGVDYYYMQLQVHPFIRKCLFMLPEDMRFGSQDIYLLQKHHTVGYARALQHWAEEAQPPVPSQLHHLEGSVLELWQAMDLLVTFAEGDVFITTVPSGWMEITSP